jgi:hypothetical protein
MIPWSTQPRPENPPSRTELGRAMLAMIDPFCTSYSRVPKSIVLDVDDTFDTVRGNRQLSLFNAKFSIQVQAICLQVTIFHGVSPHRAGERARVGRLKSDPAIGKRFSTGGHAHRFADR